MAAASDLRRRLEIFRRRRRQRDAAATMTVVEHLRELRRRLIYAGLAFVIVSIGAFFFFEPVIEFIRHPLCQLPPEMLGPQGCNFVGIGPTEPFSVRMKVTAMVGLILSSPIWIYQIWAFVTPGLTASEKRYALPFILSSVTLFVVGTTFAYMTLEPGLRFLIGLGEGQITPFLQADSYLSFVGLMFIGFGLAFELPLLLFFLGLADVVPVDTLRKQRRIAVVAIVALSAVATPSQDPYTLMIMALPLYLLYELVILLLRRIKKDRPAASV